MILEQMASLHVKVSLCRLGLLQLYKKYEPALEAQLDDFLEYQTQNVGFFQPLSLIFTDPALYGFLGCTCLADYDAVVATDIPGKQLLPGHLFAVLAVCSP